MSKEEIASFYDVFVDWPGRLGREMPGLLQRLHAAGARRILDAGCGTGRHVATLREEGFLAYGADASDEMVARARAFGDPEWFCEWRMGDTPPTDLKAPFDAAICLGNTWSMLTGKDDAERAAVGLRGLLRPGAPLLVGLKALAIRKESGNPYLPLLRREHEGGLFYFVRFVDFDTADAELCDFHMLVVRDDADSPVEHRTRPMRVWSPAGLIRCFLRAGFETVRVSARLGDPDVAPTSEDVFVHAS
ncbi:MAG: class I SAM-dependent methyltransferase [Planctomycetota bacterium]|jgi:SAM-dependent methyltransferase